MLWDCTIGDYMIKYDSVIFDLDGTLLSTLGDLHTAVCAALSSNGMPVRTLDEVRSFLGNGIRLLIERAVPAGTDKAAVDSVFESFKKYYGDHCEDTTAPYEGVLCLLEKLKSDRIKCAIVSNKADFAVKKLADHFFGGLIETAIGEREGIAKKPAPDSVFEAIRILGSKHPVYVGDSEVDVATAKNAKIAGSFVDWGFRSREVLLSAGALEISSTPDELYRKLTKED